MTNHVLTRSARSLSLNGVMLLTVYDAGDCDTPTTLGANLYSALYDAYQCQEGLHEGDTFELDGAIIAECVGVEVLPLGPLAAELEKTRKAREIASAIATLDRLIAGCWGPSVIVRHINASKYPVALSHYIEDASDRNPYAEIWEILCGDKALGWEELAYPHAFPPQA